MTAHRPTIAVTRHAIAAGHYLATVAGFDILQAGGNAIDAGVAAGIALGVVQSDLVNVAGVAPILIYHAERREVVTIAGLGTWPRALEPGPQCRPDTIPTDRPAIPETPCSLRPRSRRRSGPR